MARHDRLIAFLEKEAAATRDRIAGLREQQLPPTAVTSGDGAPSRAEEIRREAEDRLAEIESHLEALRRQDAA